MRNNRDDRDGRDDVTTCTHSTDPWEQSDRALGGGPLHGGAIITRRFPGNVIPSNADMSKFCIAENVKPENARRIVACVNACKGIQTKDLERWGISLIDKIRDDEGHEALPHKRRDGKP